jgi:NYN domain
VQQQHANLGACVTHSDATDDETFSTPPTWKERADAARAAKLKSTAPITIASSLAPPSLESNLSAGSVASSYQGSLGGGVSPQSPLTSGIERSISGHGPLSTKIAVFKKFLGDKFYFDEATITAENMGTPLTAPAGVHVFVDLSNILIGLEKYVDEHPYVAVRGALTSTKSGLTQRPGLDFEAFSLLMERGRPAAKRFVLGSWPVYRSNAFSKMLDKARKRGYETIIWQKVQRRLEGPQLVKSPDQQRTPTKTGAGWMEQGVDEGIQLKIADSLLFETAQTMVIATGDGAKSTLGPGFAKYVEKALELGWKVELLAWSKSASLKYRDVNWQFQWEGQFRFVDLEDFAEHLFAQPP